MPNEKYLRRLKDKEDHKGKLEAQHGIAGNPKADLLYQKAWELGHSCGLHEVEIYYGDLAELIAEVAARTDYMYRCTTVACIDQAYTSKPSSPPPCWFCGLITSLIVEA